MIHAISTQLRRVHGCEEPYREKRIYARFPTYESSVHVPRTWTACDTSRANVPAAPDCRSKWHWGVARLGIMIAPRDFTLSRWAVLAATSARLLRDH